MFLAANYVGFLSCWLRDIRHDVKRFATRYPLIWSVRNSTMYSSSSALVYEPYWHQHVHNVRKWLIPPFAKARSSERLEVSIQNLESFSLASAYFWYARVDGITGIKPNDDYQHITTR